MIILDITNPRELPDRINMRGYVCMTALQAATMHAEKHGATPDIVYQYTNSVGKMTVFVPEGEITA